MSNADIALMAHLMRRAGFGASRDELEQKVSQGYENVVESLLNPGAANAMPDDVIRRFHVDMAEMRELNSAGAYWIYRMVDHGQPAGREDGTVLAQPVRHRLLQAEPGARADEPD